jgi:hypothetical protein
MHHSKRRKTSHGDFKTPLLSTFNNHLMMHLQGFMTNKDLQKLSICSVETDRLVVPLVTPCLTWRSSPVWRPARLAYIRKMIFDLLPIGELPPLTHLTFGDTFNQPIGELNLTTLTHLSFGDTFNQPFGKLVQLPALTHLTFGYEFNQPINDELSLPALTHLTFGRSSDQLPATTNLTLRNNFLNRPSNTLPALTDITFCGSRHNLLPNVICTLPKSLLFHD